MSFVLMYIIVQLWHLHQFTQFIVTLLTEDANFSQFILEQWTHQLIKLNASKNLCPIQLAFNYIHLPHHKMFLYFKLIISVFSDI